MNARVTPVGEAVITPGEDNDQQRELDLLLRTPASLTTPIREIEAQVRRTCQQRVNYTGGSEGTSDDAEEDEDAAEAEEDDEGGSKDKAVGCTCAAGCSAADMDFDSMNWPCFIFETVVNLLAPFSVVLVWVAEGVPGLKRRDFIGIRRFPQWFILMGQYMLSLMTWLVVAMVVADPSIVHRENLRVDFLYMLTSIVIRSVLVAFKWATVPSPCLFNSSARRRENEIIFGWLAFSEGAAVRQAVKTVLHCRLGGEMPAVVMSQGTSLYRYRCGDTELVHAVAKASNKKLLKLGALTHRFNEQQQPGSPFSRPGMNRQRSVLPGRRQEPPSTPDGRSSDGMVGTSRSSAGEVWNPMAGATGDTVSSLTGGDVCDDTISFYAFVGNSSEDARRKQQLSPVPVTDQQPAEPEGHQRRVSRDAQLPSASAASPPGYRASVQWRDGRRGSSQGLVRPSPASRFHFRGFGRAFNLPLTRIFAEITLRGGLQQSLGLRIMLRASWALASALLPIFIRAMRSTKGTAIGTSVQGHIIILTCAVEVFMINFNFQASYLECCVVTYYRLLYYMRELLAITTQDPCLLELSTLRQRALPVYMPLCMRANLLGWLRLRRALLRFGMSFRTRIQAFFALVLLRVFVFLAILAVEAIQNRNFCPVLAAVASLEMLVLTVVIITIVFTGIKIHKLMDEQLLQLQHLRLDWQIAESDYWDKVSEAAVAEKEVVQLAVDYAQSDRRLNGLQLLGVPMDGRALVNIVATVVPLLSAMYYLSRFIDFTF